ncbi:hypothetical protein MASR2M78_23580 [Treponema sp.]
MIFEKDDARRYRIALNLLKKGYLGPSPDFTDRIMNIIRQEAPHSLEIIEERIRFRDWIVVGLLIALSLTLTPFGQDFEWLVRSLGSFMLVPFSITLGVVLTIYCSYFIASHLDELSERFGLGKEN